MIIYKLHLIAVVILIAMFLSDQHASLANPIVERPILSEIHFTPGGWVLEICVPPEYGLENLDYLRLVCNAGTAQFNPGIVVEPEEIITILNSDLQESLAINPDMDELYLEKNSGGNWYQLGVESLRWGSVGPPDFWVRAPGFEESVGLQLFTDYWGDWDYWIAIEKPSTIGYNAQNVNKRAVFEGHVYDMNGMPLEGVRLKYCNDNLYNGYSPGVPYLETDADGYFSTDNMHCKTFCLTFLSGGEIWGDTVVIIEPDSINSHDFYLEGVFGEIDEMSHSPAFSISNYPNPASDHTTFLMRHHELSGTTGLLRLFNSDNTNSFKFKVSLMEQETEFSLILPPKMTDGPYFYILEIDNFTVATGKMIVIR